jgi:uncharacterized protein YndB with AHSA1/START domain
VIRDGGIEHEVVLAHPPERVWQALVDSGELGSWLMPNDFRAEAGHRFFLDARPDLGFIDGEVLEVKPPRLLRCRWSGAFGDTVLRIELTPDGGGTRLRLEHRGWKDEHPDYRGSFDDGWQYKLTKDLPTLLANS